jgi:hypothetical protein
MEEVVRAFNWVIEKGWVSHAADMQRMVYGMIITQAYYWATSEWSVAEVEQAYRTSFLIILTRSTLEFVF